MSSSASTALLSEESQRSTARFTNNASYTSSKRTRTDILSPVHEEQHKLQDVLDGIDNRKMQLLIRFTDKLSVTIISAFSVIAMASGGASAVGFLGLFGGEWIWIMVVVGLTLLGSLLGSYGVYKFGTLEEYTDRFRRQNEHYGSELERLQNVKHELKHSVHRIGKSVNELNESTEEMNETLQEFEGIRQHISGMCSDDGEMKEVGERIDAINGQFKRFRLMVISQERAALLSTFYTNCYRDDEIGLNPNEYKRFLGGLSTKQRSRFQERGTFHELAGDNGVLDLEEFQDLVDDILQEFEKEELRLSMERGSIAER